jgi:muramidase (phage lysozyme)
MRKRVMLFAAPLCIVAIAASVAVAAPSGAEHSRGPKLDKLHAERPTAASESNADISITQAGFDKAAKDIQDYLAYTQVTDYLAALAKQEVGDYIASLMAAEANQAAAAAAQQRSSVSSSNSSSSSYSSSYPGDFLSCVRQRESGGNYSIYNAGGSGAAGAYQFLPGTWNSIAASSGRSDLVGLDPAQASPADQDAMAQALYAQQGAAPWGGGC